MTAQGRKPRAPAARKAASLSLPLALLVACAVFLVCAAWIMPFMPDDSFISFRYAEHLASGHGLAFNAGEHPVEAYSNLLWILVCAALYQLGLNLPQVTPAAGILLGIASLAVLWDVVRRRAPLWTQQLPILLVFASFGPFVIYAVSGMETALFALLLLLVVRLAEDVAGAARARPLVAFAACGFLVSLARPEGVVVFPIALGVVAWEMRARGALAQRSRPLLMAAGAFVLATVIYHAWRVSYFGEWLPTPFLSKGAEGHSLLSGWHKNAYRYFLNWAYDSPPQGYAFAALLALAYAGVRAARGAGNVADKVALVLALALCAVYANFVDWMPGMRYHAPLAGVLLIPARHLPGLLPEEWWKAAAQRRAGRFAALSLVVLLAGATGVAQLRHATVKMTESARECYLPLADWLRDAVPPGSLLAMGDVGTVPYYTHLRTLDIHPESLTDTYIAKRSFSADYALTKRPEVIVLSVRGVYSARMDPLHWELYQNAGFRLEYGFVGTVRNQWYEDRAYWVFLRNDVRADETQLRALPEGIGLQRRTRFDP